MTWRPLPGDEQTVVPLKFGVDRLATRLGAGSSNDYASIFSKWPETVGSQVAAHATPIALKQGVLMVEVDDRRWGTQLKWLAPEICKKLNEQTGSAEVERIEIKFNEPRKR
jgi:predicted nucleic acid-binding Zn ribbon protein